MLNAAQHRQPTAKDRAQWENNPELRRSVEDELQNWATWSRGGFRDLGYPREQAWAVSSRLGPPPCDVEQAQRTEDTFVLWRLVAKAAEPREKQQLATLLLVLKLHHLTSKAAHTKAKIAGVSRATFYRLLEDAEYRYWVLRIEPSRTRH